MAHRLSEKDKSALVATCSECGPGTPIARNGKYGFVCREARRQAQRRSNANNPAKARERRRRPASKHRLVKRDGTPDVCRVCGPVTPVVMGRGYGCPNRATELGWKVFAEAPQPKCATCRAFLTYAGECLRCSNEANVDDIFVPVESRRHVGSAYAMELMEHGGFSFVEHDPLMPAENESAVFGWKTLGSFEPVGSRPAVRPEYAKLYGSGKR